MFFDPVGQKDTLGTTQKSLHRASTNAESSSTNCNQSLQLASVYCI